MAEQPKPKTPVREEIPAMFKDSFFVAGKGGKRKAVALPIALILHTILVAVLIVAPAALHFQSPEDRDHERLPCSPAAAPSAPAAAGEKSVDFHGPADQAGPGPDVSSKPASSSPPSTSRPKSPKSRFRTSGSREALKAASKAASSEASSEASSAASSEASSEKSKPPSGPSAKSSPRSCSSGSNRLYPDIAREARVDGIVIIEAQTDIYGRVQQVKILRSIPLLDQAATDAVRQWVYEPMVINGRPRGVIFTVTVRFTLK